MKNSYEAIKKNEKRYVGAYFGKKIIILDFSLTDYEKREGWGSWKGKKEETKEGRKKDSMLLLLLLLLGIWQNLPNFSGIPK